MEVESGFNLSIFLVAIPPYSCFLRHSLPNIYILTNTYLESYKEVCLGKPLGGWGDVKEKGRIKRIWFHLWCIHEGSVYYARNICSLWKVDADNQDNVEQLIDSLVSLWLADEGVCLCACCSSSSPYPSILFQIIHPQSWGVAERSSSVFLKGNWAKSTRESIHASPPDLTTVNPGETSQN